LIYPIYIYIFVYKDFVISKSYTKEPFDKANPKNIRKNDRIMKE
jgi:hypothetical protein